jgi:hypothetical protein
LKYFFVSVWILPLFLSIFLAEGLFSSALICLCFCLAIGGAGFVF